MSDTTSDKTPTRREKDFARHHREIMAAAAALFAERGYYQTTMKMIADKAEFSVGYLDKHFDGKEELHREMVFFHLEHMERTIKEVEALDLSPLETIRRTLEMTSRHFNQHRDFMRIYHEEIGENYYAMSDMKKRHHTMMSERLRSAQRAGELRSFDTDILAAAIHGAIKELFGELAERPGEHPFDDIPDLVFSLLIDPLRT